MDSLDLILHDQSSHKTLEMPTQEWLEGRHDFHQNPRTISWMTLIADLKRFLVLNTGEHESLHRAFLDEGFRIPVHDYSSAIFERSFLERLEILAKRRWFRCKAQKITVHSLLAQARLLRQHYMDNYERLLEQSENASCYSRKRLIPKLRYRAGRLVYLAPETSLVGLAHKTRGMPELHLHAAVMDSIATGVLDRVLSLGTNAAQAAAQPLRAARKPCSTSLSEFGETEQQSLAIFLLNGVTVDRVRPEPHSELLRFAESGTDSALMRSDNPFIRELACLHGLSEQPRHPSLLETAYDEDEDLALDAVDQLQQSMSG